MRALISVSDKTGVIEFARVLQKLGIDVISTGGTAGQLAENGIRVTGISEVTGFPECLDGRVKTLHPAVHGGILAMRDRPKHMRQLADLNIETIDIVAINLYPFRETVLKPDVSLEAAVENIDIGGPAMLRSAAKNHRDVTVICDPADYAVVLEELQAGGVSTEVRYRLALKAFEHTAAYDALIADYLRRQAGLGLPDNLTLTFEKVQDLRYGENPHQKAVWYREIGAGKGTLSEAEQLHGKALSFNNINDANGALAALKEFSEPAAVAVKHANPCGVAVAEIIAEAYRKAYEADPVSIYGGIVALNRPVDRETAEEINKVFIEIVIAPDFSDEALTVLQSRKNIRLLRLPGIAEPTPAGTPDLKKPEGGLLVQDADTQLYEKDRLRVVTQKRPTAQEERDMEFAMKVVKHVKSNGIVIAKDGRTLGIGPGQVNRIGAVEIAVRQAQGSLQGAVMASDAFFPFEDCVTAAAEAGITAIIQPGGSVNDERSIRKAEETGVAMVFTGMRHFRH